MESTIVKSAGMGAMHREGSTTFRVWAPNADKVFVIGDFNEWKEDNFELEHEENGYWSATTEKAKEGQEYKYLIHNGALRLQRNDPYAF